MDLSYGVEYEAFREEVRAFIAENWSRRDARDPQRVTAFRLRATAAGYLYRNIPRRFGGSEQPADVLRAQVIHEEFSAVRAPMEIAGNGVRMLVPTLLECGASWQQEKFIPPTVRGEVDWAQGYSEPGSGSDLASVRTRGELVGDEWIVNGQKIWTSRAQLCRYMFALVRTEPDAPKHQGISYLLLDLHQPGVTVRPLKQITGQSTFNEVFFDDVRTPADWIVGRRGEGWQVSRATLKHERTGIGNAETYLEQFAKLVNVARSTARNGRPAIEDPIVRDRLAEIEGYLQAHRYSTFRQLSMNLAGRNPGPVTTMNKLVVTNLGHLIAALAQELIGDASLLLPVYEPGHKVGNERWMNQFFGSLGIAIAGGTSNIQRNIIGERGLGLPRDRTGDAS
ncbi:MAG: acyl-CoA dehydrogenase family protein [Gammaproteobacteria bacterium]|nr:acyl-CoA dehydrogenase family protein [Gammaproteobacteria bacterium]